MSTSPATSAHPPQAAAGFDGFVEVFRAGPQTDSRGRLHTWTRAELDEFVRNHDPQLAPIVIGHPTGPAPRWGRAAEVRRDGDLLLAKFDQVNPVFEVAARSGAWPNRSIQAVRTPRGWRLGHVAFLGATPPAVEGLQPLAFAAAAPDDDVWLFEGPCWDVERVSRLFRGLRDWLLASAGQDTADRVLPAWEVDGLAEDAAAQRAAGAALDNPNPAYSRGAQPMSGQPSGEVAAEFAAAQARIAELEAEVERREAALAAAATAQRLADARAWVAGQAHLTPAMATGMAEFVAALDGAETFEFAAAGGGTQQQRPGDWFRAFVGRLPETVALGRRTDPPPAVPQDAQAIADAAVEYQAAQAVKGRAVSITEAVAHVRQQGGAQA